MRARDSGRDTIDEDAGDDLWDAARWLSEEGLIAPSQEEQKRRQNGPRGGNG